MVRIKFTEKLAQRKMHWTLPEEDHCHVCLRAIAGRPHAATTSLRTGALGDFNFAMLSFAEVNCGVFVFSAVLGVFNPVALACASRMSSAWSRKALFVFNCFSKYLALKCATGPAAPAVTRLATLS